MKLRTNISREGDSMEGEKQTSRPLSFNNELPVTIARRCDDSVRSSMITDPS